MTWRVGRPEENSWSWVAVGEQTAEETLAYVTFCMMAVGVALPAKQLRNSPCSHGGFGAVVLVRASKK